MRGLENYVKAVLYAYPLLESIEEDYAEHIQNRAVLSYRSNRNAEEVALYLAQEILEQRALLWLRTLVEEVLDKLSSLEKLLIQIRYFGKERKIKKKIPPVKEGGYENWSESKYFRRQSRLACKVGGLLAEGGLTKELFWDKFAKYDVIKTALRVLRKKGRGIGLNEREWLRFETNAHSSCS